MYTADQLRIAKLENVHRIDQMIAKLREAHDVQGAAGQTHAITHTVRELRTLKNELIEQNKIDGVKDENDRAYADAPVVEEPFWHAERESVAFTTLPIEEQAPLH